MSVEGDLKIIDALVNAGQVSGDGPVEFGIDDFSSRFLSLSDDEATLEVKGRWSAPPYGNAELAQKLPLEEREGHWCVKPRSTEAPAQSDDEPQDPFHHAVPDYLHDLVELLTMRLSFGLTKGSAGDNGDASANMVVATPPERPPDITAKAIQTASGLQYTDLGVGLGQAPSSGDTAVLHYNEWVADEGGLVDSSIERREFFVFPLGQDLVIEGLEEGISTMKEGGVRRLIIPPDLAYGEQGFGADIPPDATLIFDVALLLVR